ncbi:MAG: ATP-dependent 6-phosphofructokinase [Anaerolineae bacterium]|nr:ATP-dependent 6-phosphofructokinase [Anaerolineae bacterium]
MAQKAVGILTSGGDCPGLNAAIRGVGKATRGAYGNQIIGFRDGFRGLVENRIVRLDDGALSGILTLGGTILGTSRDKPHKMPVGKQTMDMVDVAVDNYHRHHLDVLVCLGGAGTQKNAYRLAQRGLNIITLPKTIDNDVWGTDVTFGFDTAMGIAAEAIDRLHTTAESHHRIIVVEIMGHNTGWLALGAGIAGGADVILIPEIPYDIASVADAVRGRSRAGKRFSIIAMAEGALSREEASALKEGERDEDGEHSLDVEAASVRLARQLQAMTGLEARVTALGHLQRGGTPSPTDRLLATRLGTSCAALIEEGAGGVMVAIRRDKCKPVSLKKVAGRLRTVPEDHAWIRAARLVGTSFGD